MFSFTIVAIVYRQWCLIEESLFKN